MIPGEMDETEGQSDFCACANEALRLFWLDIKLKYAIKKQLLRSTVGYANSNLKCGHQKQKGSCCDLVIEING